MPRKLEPSSLSLTDKNSQLCQAASYVLSQNIVHGDALTMKTASGEPITFAEWAYLGRGKFQRRDFKFETLTRMSAFGEEDTLFAEMGKHEIFTPTKSYPPVTIAELAAMSDQDWTPESGESIE